MKNKTIYMVTTLRFGFKYMNSQKSKDGIYHSYIKRTSPTQKKYFTIISSRTWGWYFKLEHAKQCVETNNGDIYEYEYNYAVIEETSEGIFFGLETPNEFWYEWKGSSENGKYKPWKKPKEYDNIICFCSRTRPIHAYWGNYCK